MEPGKKVKTSKEEPPDFQKIEIESKLHEKCQLPAEKNPIDELFPGIHKRFDFQK
jgi:hypothetical protein